MPLIQHVEKDPESILSFANQEMLAFFMYFRGEKTVFFDNHLGNISRMMTNQALQFGGSYYLPYRPYQTVAQFMQAYPNYQYFQKIKLKYDDEEFFLQPILL